MSHDTSTTGFDSPTYGEGPDSGSSTKDVAKDQAANVAGSATEAGQHVAGVAKDQAANVAAEAKGQAKNIAGQARAELSSQASDQQQRVATGLRSIGSELGSMADKSDESGIATDLARQASAKAHEVAEWLENRDPSSLLDEVTTFARRRPGAFLALALGAGIVAGRLGRSLKDEASSSTGSTTPATGSTGYPVGSPADGYGTGPATPYQETAPTYASAPVETYPPVEPYEPVQPVGGAVYSEEVIETPPYTGNSAYAGDTAYADEVIVEKTTYTDGTQR